MGLFKSYFHAHLCIRELVLMIVRLYRRRHRLLKSYDEIMFYLTENKNDKYHFK